MHALFSAKAPQRRNPVADIIQLGADTLYLGAEVGNHLYDAGVVVRGEARAENAVGAQGVGGGVMGDVAGAMDPRVRPPSGAPVLLLVLSLGLWSGGAFLWRNPLPSRTTQ